MYIILITTLFRVKFANSAFKAANMLKVSWANLNVLLYRGCATLAVGLLLIMMGDALAEMVECLRGKASLMPQFSLTVESTPLFDIRNI